MKFELVENWKAKWKAASVWVSGVWAALLGALAVNPSFITNAIPEELKSMLPAWLRFALTFVAVVGTVYAARIVKQPSVSGQQ